MFSTFFTKHKTMQRKTNLANLRGSRKWDTAICYCGVRRASAAQFRLQLRSGFDSRSAASPNPLHTETQAISIERDPMYPGFLYDDKGPDHPPAPGFRLRPEPQCSLLYTDKKCQKTINAKYA